MDTEFLTRLILILAVLIVILFIFANVLSPDSLTNFGSMIAGLVKGMISSVLF